MQVVAGLPCGGLEGADAPGWVVQQVLAVGCGAVACCVCWNGLLLDAC